MSNSDTPNPIISSELPNDDAIKHGFFSRTGGVSKGIYEGLNVGIGSNDNQQHVQANRARVAGHFDLQPEHLITLYQIHSPNAVAITEPVQGERPKADAVVTNTPGLVAGVLTADCGPVLFSDAKAGVVGAAHAGWQGAISGVLENTITTMESLGANRKNITAVLGPTISQKNYEVGPEFVERLKGFSADNTKWLITSDKPNHAMFDLPGYIVERLSKFGVAASWTGHCTYADSKLFFSYRRKTHLNEADYGRQISAISIV
ncbi:MAG: peptidoglycan editing factor PgeF [Salaquimonas sp.]